MPDRWPLGLMKQLDDHRLRQTAKCELAVEVLRSSGSVRFAATGWSMVPSIWPGETLVVERIAPEEICVGDVVVVGRSSALIAHRVISIAGIAEDLRWITQGDALSLPDSPVSEPDLLGRVAYLIRDGKCVPVPAELSVIQNVLARIVRRSVPATRALVYLNRRLNG